MTLFIFKSSIFKFKCFNIIYLSQEASKVLESLLEEDDEVVEVWYLLGWSNYIRGEEEYKRNAQFYLRKAKEVMNLYICYLF